MGAVEGIELDIASHSPCATYPRDDSNLVKVNLALAEGISERADDGFRALMKVFNTTPSPHPGHQIWGIRSMRRNSSIGFLSSGRSSSLIGLPP